MVRHRRASRVKNRDHVTAPNSRIVARWIGVDGDAIILTVSGLLTPSVNGKTSDMLQAIIMPEDLMPSDAIKTGQDAIVCGGCPLRPGSDGDGPTCYVWTWRGPDGVWRATHGTDTVRSITDTIAPLRGCSDPSVGHNRNVCESRSHTTDRPVPIRLGTWGDPALIPLPILRELAAPGRLSTGYSHQWKTCDPEYRRWLMASIDGGNAEADRAEANARGWSTYRVRAKGEAPLPGSVECPYTGRADSVTCSTCGLCCGSESWLNGKPRKPLNVEVTAI